MNRRLTILIPLALAIALLAAPAAHAAAEAEEQLLPPLPPRKLMTQVGAPVPPREIFRSGFQVEAGDGYKVGVSTFGSAVILVVSRGNRKRLDQTIYLAKGVATPNRLQATFGNFGKVSMRFRQSGSHRFCRGLDQFIRDRGVFVGSLRFRGEGGYVSVRVHRAKGGILRPAGRCPHPPKDHHLPGFFFGPISALFAESRDGVNTTDLLAFQLKGKTALFATHAESRGKLAIVRVAGVVQDHPIHVNEAVTSAHLSPPTPFHGTGRYRAAPDGTATWTGDLTVNFPGAPHFPLTGPDFKVFLEVPF